MNALTCFAGCDRIGEYFSVSLCLKTKAVRHYRIGKVGYDNKKRRGGLTSRGEKNAGPLNRSAFCTPLSVLNTPLLFFALFRVHMNCGPNTRCLWVRLGALTFVVECQYSFVTCEGRVQISELSSFVFPLWCRNPLLLTNYRKATAC